MGLTTHNYRENRRNGRTRPEAALLEQRRKKLPALLQRLLARTGNQIRQRTSRIFCSPRRWRGGVYKAARAVVEPFAQQAATSNKEHTSELQSRGHLVCRL